MSALNLLEYVEEILNLKEIFTLEPGAFLRRLAVRIKLNHCKNFSKWNVVAALSKRP